MGFPQELLEVLQGAHTRMDVRVVGDVVAVVLERRRAEGQQPQGGDAEIPEIVQTLGQTPEVADAVAVAVLEGSDAKLVEDGVLVPEGLVLGETPAVGIRRAAARAGAHRK